MSFHEVRFPEEISKGSSGGPGFSTDIIEVDSGQEQRVSRREAARHFYDVSEAMRNLEDLSEVKRFYMARQGAAFGFRYKDWSDYHSNPSNPTYLASPGTADQECVPAAGDGSNTTFQLAKRYTSGPGSHQRLIYKPVEDTVSLWVNGVLQSSGYTVDHTTGLVTFSVAPANGLDVEASFEFDVPVRFDKSADDLMDSSIEDYSRGTAQLNLVEIMNPGSAGTGNFNYGGAAEVVFFSNYLITLGHARFWVMAANTAGLFVSLPDPAGIPTGAPIFYIVNGGVNSFTVKDHLGGTLCTLAAGQGCTVILSVDNSSGKIWYTL